jgi:hypothetical protein
VRLGLPARSIDVGFGQGSRIKDSRRTYPPQRKRHRQDLGICKRGSARQDGVKVVRRKRTENHQEASRPRLNAPTKRAPRSKVSQTETHTGTDWQGARSSLRPVTRPRTSLRTFHRTRCKGIPSRKHYNRPSPPLAGNMASTDSTMTEVVVHRVRTKYHWPALQLNFWLLIMIIGSATILGIFSYFVTVQQQLQVGIPW